MADVQSTTRRTPAAAAAVSTVWVPRTLREARPFAHAAMPAGPVGIHAEVERQVHEGVHGAQARGDARVADVVQPPGGAVDVTATGVDADHLAHGRVRGQGPRAGEPEAGRRTGHRHHRPGAAP